MTITIDLPLEIETKIKTQALQDGVKLEDYVKSLIKEASDKREKIEKSSEKSFDEILSPFRRGFQESGLSEDELLELLTSCKNMIWSVFSGLICNYALNLVNISS